MGQVIKFPREPQSMIESMVRASLREIDARLSPRELEQVVRNSVRAFEQWNVSDLPLPYTLPSEIGPDILTMIQQIAEQAANEGLRAVRGRAIAERLHMEIELARTGIDYTIKPKAK